MSKNERNATAQVHFLPIGRRGTIAQGTTVLEAARQLGIEIESICGGRQTCAKCRVRIVEGEFPKLGIESSNSSASTVETEELDCLRDAGDLDLRLSCVAQIQKDVVIEIPAESMTQKQVIRKDATARIIEIKPAIQQVYLEVAAGILGEHAGDWGRLQQSLADETGINATIIDLRALQKLQPALMKGARAVTVFVRDGHEVIEVLPGYQEGMYGLAIDMGTTTIAAFLCDLRNGDLLATGAVMNPQISYGEDLMSRISYVTMNDGGLDTLHRAMIQSLNQLIRDVTAQAGISIGKLFDAVVVGNTTMTSIFLGIDPTPLGGAPFALANRDAYVVTASALKLRLHPSANVHILPSQAGHVGADNVAVLLAEEPYLADENTLIVDVGTNAEIVLGNRSQLMSASSPTGPAFEGGQITFGMRAAPGAIERVRIDPNSKQARFKVIGEERWSDEWSASAPSEVQAAGICGSGIIEVVAELFLAGVIDSTGRFIEGLDVPQVVWQGRTAAYQLAGPQQTANGKAILVTQEDIRNIQLAKAALYAGVKLLMLEAEITEIEQIKLAGAFGSYIDPKYAMILGLIPDCNLSAVRGVGNAAGDGARIALLNMDKRGEAEDIARNIRYIETAVHPEFQEEFVAALDIPHKADAFPSLAEFLPAKKRDAAQVSRRKRKFNRT